MMERRVRRAAAAFVTTLLLAAPAAGDPVVEIVHPPFGAPAFGEVELRAAVTSTAPIARVTFRVDGHEAATLSGPPWVIFVDVGAENANHYFEVEAVDGTGAVGRAAFTSPKVPTDEEISVELRQLFVTVSRDGDAVPGLAEGDFTIREDGFLRHVKTFAGGDVAFSVVLLVDASRSMRGRPLEIALAGARSFVEAMAEADEASVLLFSDGILWETPFARDPDLLLAPLAEAAARGGTAIHDALYVALKRLEPLRRRTVVVLASDGVDVDSVLGADELRWAVRRSASQLYWLRSRDVEGRRVLRSSIWRGPEEHAAALATLEETVVESGGRVLDVPSIEGVEAALREVLRELRGQYVLGYTPSRELDGGWHRIEVEVGDACEGCLVRTRAGYLGDGDQH